MKLTVRLPFKAGMKLYRRIYNIRTFFTTVTVFLLLMYFIQLIANWQSLGTVLVYSLIATGVGVVFGIPFRLSKKIKAGATPWWINKKL